MAVVTDYIVPLLLLLSSAACLRKHADPYARMLEGGKEGLQLALSILPPLVVLLSAFSMLRASGALDALTALLTPAVKWLGIPAEIVPLMLLRPLSGSAALAVGADLIAAYGPDSRVGLCSAVLLGSTETTFYAISVYFGAAGIRRTRYAVPAALLADLTGFFTACLTARFLE